MFGFLFMILLVFYEMHFISLSLYFLMGCYFPFLVFSSELGFFAPHWYACNLIFQVSREQEKCMRTYFLDKFTSYSLFSAITHCSLCLLCLNIIFWVEVCFIELILNMFIFVFACALYVWIFIYHLVGFLWDAFDFPFLVFCHGLLFSLSRLFVRSRFLCPWFIRM